MQFSKISVAAVLALLPLISAIPVAQSDSANPSCYDKCMNDRFCIMSYPEGCYCANNNRKECATECGVPVPELEVCEPEKDSVNAASVTPEACFDQCVAETACIQRWPHSCHCENGVRQACAEKCVVRVVLKECPPIDA